MSRPGQTRQPENQTSGALQNINSTRPSRSNTSVDTRTASSSRSSSITFVESTQSCSRPGSETPLRRLPSRTADSPVCEPRQPELTRQNSLSLEKTPQEGYPHYMQQTQASVLRQRVPAKYVYDNYDRPATVVARASTVPLVTGPSLPRSKPNPSVLDKTFYAEVLQQYGVVVARPVGLKSPVTYFDMADDNQFDGDMSARERYQRRYESSRIWLDFGQTKAEEVAKSYRRMASINANDAKLKFRGKRYFLKEDEPSDTASDLSGALTHLEFEWTARPNGRQLLIPPGLAGQATGFQFETTPDCTYWLATSLAADSVYAGMVRSMMTVLPTVNTVAPYLTIEFRKSGDANETTRNRVAVASSLLVYNRYRLRCLRLKECRQSFKMSSFDSIKHYSIEFNKYTAAVYVTTPRLSFDESGEASENSWMGCKIDALTKLDLCQANDILALQDWINGIHKWGLGQHYEGVNIDIKGSVLQKGPEKQRESMIDSLSLEESKRLDIVTGAS